MEYFFSKNKCGEIYIKKFKFFEYLVYFKEGYLVLETSINLRQINEFGDKYYDIDKEIITCLKDISGSETDLSFATEIDPLPFRNNLTGYICSFNLCKIELVEGYESCDRHIILKSLKKWLLGRYLNEYEWGKKIEILIY
tara:strand:+ start:885 stop:1304 length:420 start_codon:yes stop_codon:yes gene_type:complete